MATFNIYNIFYIDNIQRTPTQYILPKFKKKNNVHIVALTLHSSIFSTLSLLSLHKYKKNASTGSGALLNINFMLFI